MSPPNDMDPFQLNGGCQNSYGYTWSDHEFSQFALSPVRMHTFALDEYSLIEMSNADDERAAAAVVNASIRWKQLFCVVTWTFSSSKRVSVNVGHPPKRKKQRVG